MPEQIKGTQKPVEGATDPDAMYPVNTGRGRRPWDRRPDEPGRIFMVFLQWLALPERTPARLHDNYRQITVKQIMQLCDRFDLANRTERYDSWAASLAQHSLEGAENAKAIDIARTVKDL